MNSKVRGVLLFVVLFVIASSSLFAQTRAFDATHIDVSVQSPGPGGIVIIGSTVMVELTDPDLGLPAEITAAEVDFSQFQGPTAVPMVWDGGDSKWKAQYQVSPGTLNNTNARVKIHSLAINTDEQIKQDDLVLVVNNISTQIGYLNIAATISDPGPTGIAIVGSTIEVTFDDATIVSASADFTPFGGSIVPMTQTGTVFTASYLLTSGITKANLPVRVHAFILGNPNAGYADSNPVNVDNIVPTLVDVIAPNPYLSITTRAATLLKLGQSIQVQAKFSPGISKATIDWSQSFASGTVMEYNVVGGNLIDAIYTPVDGDLVYIGDLEVKIVKLESAAGNISDIAFVVTVSGNVDGDPIVADLLGPVLTVNDHDLYFDNDINTGWLRFSPNSPAAFGFDHTPDHVELMLDLERWGIPADIQGLQLRFEAERYSFVRDYEVGSPFVSVSGSTLTISWDGKDDLAAFVGNGTYGVTLWKLWDQVGNTTDLSDVYYIADEFPGHANLLDVNGDPQVILNRAHVVVDNSPMEFASPLAVNGPVEFVREIHVDHFVGDVPFADQVDDNWTTATSSDLSFRARRSFMVDTNPMRHEWGYHWSILTEDNGDQWYWKADTAQWVSFVVFDFATMNADLQFSSITAQTSQMMNFVWDATDFQPAYTEVAGDYERNFSVITYMKDNAGNIAASDQIDLTTKLTVTEHTYTSNLALVQDIQIISEHDGGTYTLPPYDGSGDHNFYLNATPYYPVSSDVIEIEVTINDASYLKADDGFVMDLSLLGLPVVYKTAADFDVNHKVIITIDNAQMNTLVAGKAGLWTIGPNGAMSIPVTVISSVTVPGLSQVDYPRTATMDDKFNLVIPTAPVYPTPGTVVSDISVISPGHASWTYNAQINPANDGVLDQTDITINVPAASYPLQWTLRAENEAGDIWSKTGTLAANTPLVNRVIPFMGLTNDLQALIDMNSVGEIDVELRVVATQYADDGYVLAQDQVTSTTLIIDNENPKVVDYTGYTYDHSTRTVSFDVTPVVSNLSNLFEVVLKTNEALRTDNLNVQGTTVVPTGGWLATITDANGDPLMVGINTVSATVLNVSDLGDNTYKIKVQVNNIADPSELVGNICVLRLPWDAAGNPGRYNDPVYPVSADLFGFDSSEINFSFDVLNDRPWISKLEFTNHKSVGTIEYNEAGDIITQTLGYIGNKVASSTVKAWISGLNTRAIVPNYSLDLAAIPGATITGVPVHAIDGSDKTITWTINRTGAIVTNAPYDLPVVIESTEQGTTTPVYYTTGRNIIVNGDIVNPTVSSSSFDGTNNFVTAGATTPFSYIISDALAGIWYDAASISLSFTNGVISSALDYTTVPGTVSGTITLPANTAIKNFIATFKVKDMVNNETVLVRNINVIPAPMPSNVAITATFPAAPLYFRPGTDINVAFDISNPERADKIEVKLINVTTDTQVGVTQVINAPDLPNYTQTFAAVTIPHTNTLRADVIVTYSKYNDAAAVLNTAATNTASNLLALNLIADGTDPDGLPVITAVEPQIELIAGSSQILSFTITDAGSGVDWATPTISFDPATGITVGALDVSEAGKAKWNITVDAGLVAQRVVATITAKDKVVNENTLLRYLNIVPIPVVTVTNISVTDNDPVNPDPTNWFVPGHDLKVSFNVSNPERVNSLTVTLTTPGITFTQPAQTFTVGNVTDPMEVIFLNVDPGLLDGKVITATVTGNTQTYSDAGTGTTSITDLIAGSDDINVDTKPVIIESVEFFLNAAATDPIYFLLPTMTNLKAVVKVKSPNDITIPVISLPALDGTVAATYVSGPVITGLGADRVLTYTYDVDVIDLTYDAVEQYGVSHFKVDTATIYGYIADTYDKNMIVIGASTADQYGVVPPERSYEDVGRAPNGWFAPENNLITEYKFISSQDPANVGIRADFDRIEDNVPDNWNDTPVLTHEIIPVTLGPGLIVNVYRYLAVWNIVPDYASVWNAYADGQGIQIDYKYWSFLPAMVEDYTDVQVDKEVPTYEDSYYEIAVAVGAAAPVYEMISTPVGSDQYKTINLALTPPAPGTWPADQHVYLKLQINDGPGVGAGWVNNPVAAGWTVATHDSVWVGNTFYKEWKLSPDDAITNASQLTINLQQVEDLTGHKNYAGVANTPIHSNLYVATAPVIQLGFNAGSNNGVAASMIAYQKLADPLDTMISPYIMPGMNLGFQIELVTTRAAEVASIMPILVQINDPSEIDDSNANWHDLVQTDPADPYAWHLAANLPITPAETVNSLGLKYMITYRITYVGGAVEEKTFTSAWADQDLNGDPLILIDRTAPQFVVDGVVVRSESSVTDNYVVPGEEVNITVLFTDEHAYNDPNTKPSVSITNLDSFLDSVSSPYIVAASDINYVGGQWKAYVSGLASLTNPATISEIIVVTLTDPVGHASMANKFVEIANQGPIVPLIRDAKYLTQIYDGTWKEAIVEALAGQSVNSKIEVYIDAEYEVYIDDVSITVPAGVNVVVPPAYTIRPALPGEAGRWVAVFENVVATDMVAGDITFIANTERTPYSAPIFEHHQDFTASVDMMDFMAAAPVVMAEALDGTWINDIINPDRNLEITVDLADLGEDFVASLPLDISPWITLESIPAALLSNIQAPVITGAHTATWTIIADDVADLGLTDATIKVTYNNIYDQSRSIEKDFFIDIDAPVIIADGIQFVGGDNFSYPQAEISTSADWTDLKVYLDDPLIVAHAGSGLHVGTLQLIPQALTYQETPEMAALNTYVANTWGTDANGTFLKLSLEDVFPGFTAYDLAIGHYDIKVNTTDLLGNTAEYIQVLYFNPATTSITLSPVSIDNEVDTSEESLILHALVNDPTGTVNGVHFRLYYDLDADGVFTPGTDPEYASDIIAGVNGNPDMVPPFHAEWNLTDRVHYNWAEGTPYLANTVRNFFVRVSAITQSRYITDETILVLVTDNIAPVPEVPTVTVNPLINVDPISGALVYDYATIANNSLTLNTNFVNWPDAHKAIFEISKLGSLDAPVVIESAVLVNPIDPVSVVWNYGSIDPNYDPTGTYTVTVKGVDYVGNVLSDADAVSLPLDIVIDNPANLVTYTINLRDIVAYNNYQPINAEYGKLLDANNLWENPFTNLRLNANFSSLQGISELRFRMTKTNLVDGTEVTTNITNDQAWQADYVFDADGYITADQIVANNAYVFLNDSDYQTNNTEDSRYTFWVELVPTHAVSNPLFVDTTSLRIDNRAPQVAITDFITPVSWFTQGQFKVEDADAPGYDIADIVNQNNIHLEWFNATDNAWYPAVFGTVVNPTIADDFYTFQAWDIAGGSVNTFLGENFAGAVQVRVVANDVWGNTFTSPVALPVVDNEAPVTRFTHVIHSVNYPDLTAITDLANAPDVLDIVSSTQGTNGSSNLQLFVDASTLGADTVMPLMMYHQTPNGIWQPVEYDHEAWNLGNAANPDLYEFVIPNTKLVAGDHRFTVVRKDAMGNLEGDIASGLVAYNGTLNDNEKLLATDLVVSVTSIDDVIATIQYPADLAFIGGRKAITATTTDDAAVEQITFQHKVGTTWQTIATVTKAAVHPVTFELLRSDIPQFNELPVVPGVHLFNGATELGELMWNGTSWTSVFDLTVGTAYSFQYGIDLNNNGTWDAGEPLINDPKGFTNFTPTPWTLAFDSNDYAQGLHEFRAIPLDTVGAELTYYQSPSSWMIIDNVKPVINGITSVGNITDVTPGTVVPFVTDLTALLVATDDIVNVRYEYSGQMLGAMNRIWTVFGNTNNMSGNYLQNWIAANPLNDNVDNNGNGLVDEAAEANGTFFIRAIASDRAGNFQISNEFAVNVDNSPAEMALFEIEGINLATTNYIYEIDPSLAAITLSASEIVTGFDLAVSAEFSYKFIADIDNAWPAIWTPIGAMVPVANGVASAELDFIQEGYYQFMVTAYDALGNNNSTVTNVIFNDVTGPEITFTTVGTIPVISEKYAFAQITNDFNGSLTAHLTDIAGVSAVTFEYSTSGLDGSWVNIATTNTIPAGGMVTVNWTYPPLRAPLLYLKAVAQDANANNMQSELVKIYHDTTAPNVDEALLTLTHTVVAGLTVIDIASDIEAVLTYTDLVDGTINDVNSVTVRLVNNDDGTLRVLSSPVYTDVNTAATSFIFTPVDLAGLANETYRLEIELTDFAGNASVIIQPVAFQTLYNDTTAPAGLSIVSTSHQDNVAAYDATINFRVNYTDLIGLDANAGALSATMTYQNAVDVITTYTLDAVNHWIDFVWDPSTDFETYITNGEMNIVVNAEVKVTDLLGHESFVPGTANFFTLSYGVADATQLMVIQDYFINLNEDPLIPGDEYLAREHNVNWNLTPPQIAEVLGTSQTDANPMPLDLYAYVAHQAELPNRVSFQYWNTADATNTWHLIDANAASQQWNFVNPNFLNQYQSEYHASWNIQTLPTGTYQIKTISHYHNTADPADGSSESIVTVNIYGADSVVAPVFVVDGAIAAQVERGETYNLVLDANDPFTGEDDITAGVVYKYRFVNADNNFSPISQWQYFGDADGVFEDAWIQADFSYAWTVYPFYLFNNHIEIVAFAIDQWGTQTQIADALLNHQIVEIINTTAPAVTAISTTWNGIEDPAMISGNVANTATVKAIINTSSTPTDLVSVEFLHKFTGEADFVSFDMQEGWTANQMLLDLAVTSAAMPIPTEEAVTSVELKVISTDIYGNTNEAVHTVMIENTLPTANFIVTLAGTELTNELERGTTVVLNANPADAPAGVLNVEYFWADATANWTSIDLVDAAPWTLEFVVPETWEFGATYSLRTVVTDNITATAGNTLTVDRDFTVIDHSTDIVIDNMAGNAPSTIGIIDGRLHGAIPVTVTVNDPAIPRVQYMLRVANADTWTSLKYVDVVANDASTVFVDDEFDALASGEYYLGVRAAQARRQLYPVMADSVLFTLDNDIAITVNSTMPESNGYFNGDDFVVNFTVANDDEILENAVALQYNTTIEPTWMPAAVATLTSPDGINYAATFANVNVPVDGYYNFRIQVLDSAIPMANVFELGVAQNILVDTGLPIVAMVSINGETDLTLPLDIELGTEVAIVASAYDIAGGQIHLIASGIDKVEFYSDGTVVGEVAVGTRSRANYTYVLSTLGYEINTIHAIHAVAYDKAGNSTATLSFNVNIVAPQQLEAYAMITAMDFDANTSNNDVLYAVVKDWPNTGNPPAVAFEYFNGTAWNFFANAVDQGTYYSAAFNAELMTDVTALRAVVNANYAAPMPELAVSYNAVDHSLEVVAPAITADIFYQNELRVVESFQADPIVTALQGGVAAMGMPYMMNGNQVVDVAIDVPGTHTFWAAVLDDTGNVQLGKTELETVNAGTATDNGISLIVPAGGFAYFQDVSPAMSVPSGFTALSPQHAFFVKDNANNLVNSDLTITIAAPAAQGELVAVYYDEVTGTWSNLMAVTDNEDGSVSVAGVPSGTFVTVMQYTGVGINAMFSSIDPLHSVGATMWTTDAPQIEFFIYEGMDANGYIIPATVSSVVLYLDEAPVAPTAAFDPATGLVGYSAMDLEAGAHTMRLVVTQNGFTATAVQAFSVDTTVPVITATGGQLTATLRAISATVLDAETGILDVALTLNGALDIPMSSMNVAGNVYTYNLTDEDLFTLGYNFSSTMDLSASWTAENHLEMAVVTPVNALYTVNIVGPGIAFTGFDNGWWINPTQNTPLTFDVIAPAGREIQDNLSIDLEEMINDPVNGNYTNLIQSMQLTPVSVAGNVYSYSVNFGYSVAPNAHAIRLSVMAEDNFNVTTMSQQTYGIDYLAPVVWALSPVGDAVNPDDFPVTYESAVIPYGSNVALGIGFQDIQGFVALETGQWWWDAVAGTWVDDYLVYYTGASGLDTQSVIVTLNGEAITGTVSGGAFTYNAGMLDPGLYTVIATVGDNAGNVGSMSYSFTITGGAPTIAFDPINGDWWLNSTQANDLGFTVDSQNTLASGGVVANLYAEPGNMIIQGPITPSPVGNQYNIALLGGIVPAGQFAVRLEVIATDVYGGTSTSNQTYGIDNIAPQIALITPAENAQFALDGIVNILATITDQYSAKSAGAINSRNNQSREQAGSGIVSVTLKVIAPDGTMALDLTDTGNIQVVTESLPAAQYGTYTINLSAKDNAGNQSIITRDFMVAPTTGPTVDFVEFNNGWLFADQVNNLQFNVSGQGLSSVSASVYANPSETLLMGPLTVNPTGGVYTVSVNGNMIPADQTSIRLEVTAKDLYGNESVANYYYNVDKKAPEVTILNPIHGAEITLVDENTKLMIEAQFTDMISGMKSASGSGIASSRLVVIGPDGMQVGAAVETGAGITETSHQLTDLALGSYTVRVTVFDKAGNQAMASVMFTMVELPAPPVALEITDAHAYPNPADADTGTRFSVSLSGSANVSVRIYDFAGREVRSLDYAGKTNGKSKIEIVFDARNNDGVKLARGSYFARVIANDGMKTVEKIVKIAIRK